MSPLSEGLKCGQCGCTESLFWKSIGDKQQLCNDCFELSKHKQDSDINRKTDDRRSKLRKSTRSTRYNGKNGNNGNSSQSGAANSTSTKGGNGKSSGRGRRNLFRRAPVKAPSIPATTQHVTSLFYKVSSHPTRSILHSNAFLSTGLLHSDWRYSFIVQRESGHILRTNTRFDHRQFLREISRYYMAVADTEQSTAQWTVWSQHVRNWAGRRSTQTAVVHAVRHACSQRLLSQ